jgi:hypothetical protein
LRNVSAANELSKPIEAEVYAKPGRPETTARLVDVRLATGLGILESNATYAQGDLGVLALPGMTEAAA